MTIVANRIITLQARLCLPSLVLMLIVTSILGAGPLRAQRSPLTQIRGNTDQGIVLPQAIPLISRQDVRAVDEIDAYRRTINLGAWTDMRGLGELTLNAVNSAGAKHPENATLWIRESREYRLDVEQPNGMSSIRIDGVYGAVRHENGPVQPMDARNAIDGLVAFPMLFKSDFPATNLMLIDQGTVSVDGMSLHRVSVEQPWPGDTTIAEGNPLILVTDYYFSAQTHLLIKSAQAVLGSSTSPEQLLRVITYGDYRAVSGLLIPHAYRETLNGQVLWNLQLNQVQLNQGIQMSNFHF